VVMNVTTKQFINIETLAIKIRIQCDVSFSSGLEKITYEKRTTRELLNQKITNFAAQYDPIPQGDMIDQRVRFFGAQLIESQEVEDFEV
jgi:hypothetical protein